MDTSKEFALGALEDSIKWSNIAWLWRSQLDPRYFAAKQTSQVFVDLHNSLLNQIHKGGKTMTPWGVFLIHNGAKVRYGLPFTDETLANAVAVAARRDFPEAQVIVEKEDHGTN